MILETKYISSSSFSVRHTIQFRCKFSCDIHCPHLEACNNAQDCLTGLEHCLMRLINFHRCGTFTTTTWYAFLGPVLTHRMHVC
jgi:hypothetical protein